MEWPSATKGMKVLWFKRLSKYVASSIECKQLNVLALMLGMSEPWKIDSSSIKDSNVKTFTLLVWIMTRKNRDILFTHDVHICVSSTKPGRGFRRTWSIVWQSCSLSWARLACSSLKRSYHLITSHEAPHHRYKLTTLQRNLKLEFRTRKDFIYLQEDRNNGEKDVWEWNISLYRSIPLKRLCNKWIRFVFLKEEGEYMGFPRHELNMVF
jgi:hypothetical protein